MADCAFHLQTGPWNITVDSNDEALLGMLSRHYKGFISERASAMRVFIKTCGGDYSGDMELEFRGGKVVFSSEGYRGEIDEKNGWGEIELAMKDPFFGADYFLRIAAATLIFQRGGLLFHAAGIEKNGKGMIFVGHSGVGKTTVAKNSPAGCVLNDDLLVLYPEGEEWRVSASPFYNPTQVTPRPGESPLMAVLFLVQDKIVELRPLSMAQALAEMVANVPVLPIDSSKTPIILRRCSQILFKTPSYYLHFLPDSTFWNVLEEKLQL